MVVVGEQPVEAVWSEQAGAMSVVLDPEWEPGPVPEPHVELLWEWSLEPAPTEWAVPGVPTLVDADPVSRRVWPSREVEAYAAAVQALAGCDPLTVPDAQALADLEALLAADEHARRVRLARMRDAHVRGLARLDDEVSLRTWARKRFDDVPREDIATAELLRPCSWLWSQVPAGTVSVEAARLAGRALKKLRPLLDRADGLVDGQPGDEVVAAVVRNVVPLVSQAGLGLRDDDPLLVAVRTCVEEIVQSEDSQLGKVERACTLLAQHVPLRHLPAALAEQVDALLPTALEEKAEKARRRRGLRLDPDTRGISISPDDELYELAHTVLSAQVARDPENVADTSAKREVRRRAMDGEHLEDGDVEADGDVRFPRSRGERLHDALKLVLQQYLAAGLAGSRDKAPVAVTVTIPLEKLEKRPGARPATGASGRRLPTSLVSRWWCDAAVTGVVLSDGWIPLGATHAMRTLTALERRASKVQHGGACDGLRCCTPHDPLVTLVPHHVHSYAGSGTTSMAETVWVCARLHDAIHRGRTVPLRDGRWLDQDGWAATPAY